MTDGLQQPPRPAPAPERPSGGLGGWTRLILIASLVLNLVLIGAIVGAGLGRRVDSERRPAGEAGFALLFESLAPEHQRSIRRELILDRERRTTMRRDMMADVRSLLAALRAEPFDEAAVAEALARQGMRASDLIAHGSGLMLERFAAMSAAERRAYADTLEDRLRRRLPIRAERPGG